MKKYSLLLLLFSMAMTGLAQTGDAAASDQKPMKEKDARKALKQLQKDYDRLQADFLQLQADCQALRMQDSTLQADYAAREAARQELEAYHEQCRRLLYQEYSSYLDISFDMLSAARADSIRLFATRYADTDAEAQALALRAESCLSNKQMYDQMMALLYKPYDADALQLQRDTLRRLGQRYDSEGLAALGMSRPQWQDIDSIDIFISRYRPGVEWLQMVMRRCDSQYAADGLSATSRADVQLSISLRRDIIRQADQRQIESVRRPLSAQGNVADYILNIPWLRERYDIFTSETNPLKPSAKTQQAMKEVLDIQL